MIHLVFNLKDYDDLLYYIPKFFIIKKISISQKKKLKKLKIFNI